MPFHIVPKLTPLVMWLCNEFKIQEKGDGGCPKSKRPLTPQFRQYRPPGVRVAAIGHLLLYQQGGLD